MMKPTSPLVTRLYAAWYLCLGLAFAALAWRSYLYEASIWGVWLRLAISAGFFFLVWVTMRARNEAGRK